MELLFGATLIKASYAQQIYSRDILEGTWEAQGYQCPRGQQHNERIQIEISNQSITAKKIDAGGDTCVPTGSVTFFGTMPSTFSQENRFPLTWVTGTTNRPSCCTSPGDLLIVDENTLIGNSSTREQILFRRIIRNVQ